MVPRNRIVFIEIRAGIAVVVNLMKAVSENALKFIVEFSFSSLFPTLQAL